MLTTVPQNISQLFENGLRLWQKGFMRIVPFTLAWLMLINLPTFFLSTLNVKYASQVYAFFGEFPWLILLGYLIVLLAYNSVLYRIYLFASNQRGGASLAVWVGARQLPFVFVTMLMASILVLLGFLFLLFPGIFIAIQLSMCVPLVIINNEKPYQALKHSWRLVRNQWWRVVIVLIVPLIIYVIISTMIETNVVSLFSALSTGESIGILPNITRVVISTLYVSWAITMVVVLLNDLKIRDQSIA